MTQAVSLNTQAILLLTAPLLGQQPAANEVLTPREYKHLARYLREISCQPSDFLSSDSSALLKATQSVIDSDRLKKLLDRELLLTQALKHWQTHSIWVMSRADARYPGRLKTRLREDAPAVLYGCGNMELLATGGLAVVGSRHVDDELIDYTMAVGHIAARSDKTIVSGGARGIDQAAMRGALENGGRVCGVLADSLEKATMNRDYRHALTNNNLVLISPFDPNAGFNVGNAMQRNKLIYALSDAALVVNSDLNKGGTWAGAVEQLDKLHFVPLYTRSTREASSGLQGLRQKGALPWPNPQDCDSFKAIFDAVTPAIAEQASLF